MTTTVNNPAALVPLYDFQKRAIANPARFTFNNWSRQTGKSFTFSLRRLLRGIARNRNQILLSASERQSRELMMKVRMHLEGIIAACDGTTEHLPDGTFEGTRFAQLETRVRHRGGAFDFRVIALPANAQTARGYTGDLLLDEFAMHRDDREIWAAVYAIAMRGRGEIDVCSTPKGVKNMFARLRANALFDVTTLTIEDAVSQGLDVNVEELRAGLGDDLLWQQEFLCRFMDEATAFLTFEQIAAVEDEQIDKAWNADKAAACAALELFAGWDIGRHRDLSVFWILGREPGATLLRTVGVVEMSRTDFQTQYAMADALLGLRNLQRMCIDASGLGIPIAEEYARRFGAMRAEGVTFIPAAKHDMADRLRMRFEDRSIRIPVDAAIRNDLNSIERQILPGGGVRYAADRGVNGHADRFWALALAIRAAGTAVVPFEFHVGERRVFDAGSGVIASQGVGW